MDKALIEVIKAEERLNVFNYSRRLSILDYRDLIRVDGYIININNKVQVMDILDRELILFNINLKSRLYKSLKDFLNLDLILFKSL